MGGRRRARRPELDMVSTVTSAAASPPLPLPLSTPGTPLAAQNFDGIMAALEGGPVISFNVLQAEEAAAEQALLEDGLPTIHPPPPPFPPLPSTGTLIGYDGRPLGATSEALEQRCRSAVSSTLSRSVAAVA